ncbi:MAG: WYL domain-containing protein [Candidatus Pararuminococcus gallinarum]
MASAQVQESSVFWGWVLQFSGQMQIISPESLRHEYKAKVRKAIV